MNIIKFFKCTFIKKCSKQKKWEIVHIKFDGQPILKCKECGKIVNDY